MKKPFANGLPQFNHQPSSTSTRNHWLSMNHPEASWGCWISWWNSVACLWSRCAWNSSKRGALSVAWGTPLGGYTGVADTETFWMWKAVRTQMYLGVPWLNDLGPNFLDKAHGCNCDCMDANACQSQLRVWLHFDAFPNVISRSSFSFPKDISSHNASDSESRPRRRAPDSFDKRKT